MGELLALRLRNNKEIHGIQIGKTEMLLSQFADDMDLCLPFEKTVLNAVLDVLLHIETNTGLKVSYDKTTLYRIGSITNTDAKIYTQKKLNWLNETINTLGFDLYHENLDENLNDVVLKMNVISKNCMTDNLH